MQERRVVGPVDRSDDSAPDQTAVGGAVVLFSVL
jgi:hypothetical protein